MNRWISSLCLAIFIPCFSAEAVAQGQQNYEEPLLNYETVSRTDLTEPFHTKTKWSFVVTQGPSDETEAGDLHFCFLHEDKPVCPYVSLHSCDIIDNKPACPREGEVDSAWASYNQFYNVSLTYPSKTAKHPLLVVMAGGNWNGPGNPRGPIVWAYRPKTDTFDNIFSGARSSNTNGEARFITSGPLSGDIIVDNATIHRPYPYRITVYRLVQPTHYVRALSYNGNTTYGDGNPLAVIDSEMPEIERRLHLRKPGDPLPVPARMPSDCKILELRKGVEWCR